jgi:hypothetical protein
MDDGGGPLDAEGGEAVEDAASRIVRAAGNFADGDDALTNGDEVRESTANIDAGSRSGQGSGPDDGRGGAAGNSIKYVTPFTNSASLGRLWFSRGERIGKTSISRFQHTAFDHSQAIDLPADAGN